MVLFNAGIGAVACNGCIVSQMGVGCVMLVHGYRHSCFRFLCAFFFEQKLGHVVRQKNRTQLHPGVPVFQTQIHTTTSSQTPDFEASSRGSDKIL